MSDYFGEQIAQGKPIVPPSPQAAPVIPQAPVNPPAGANSQFVAPPAGEFVGLAVRAMGDRVFLLKDGKRYWISNPEALEKLGLTFADVVKTDQATIDVIPEGEPIR